ncbi:MAG: MurR/RpiR family transcriptional regulator [Rhizobiaceae bacterium]
MQELETQGTESRQMESNSIVVLLEGRFAGLSPRMRKAARYAIDNPEDIALHSMREVAKRAKVQHNVMLRLARELGFDSYDWFRERFRNLLVNNQHVDWLGKAKLLRQNYPQGPSGSLLPEYLSQEIDNLQQSFGPQAVEELDRAVKILSNASNIYVVGLRSLFPAAYYFHYVCRLFTDKTILLTGTGGTFADELRRVGEEDALMVFSYVPYTKDAVRAVNFASSRGAHVVSVTDSKVSPVVVKQGACLITANTSASLFASVLPALAVAQLLATLMVSSGDEELLSLVERSQKQLNSFDVYVDRLD